MSHFKVAFQHQPTIATLFHDLETWRGEQFLYSVEQSFVSVTDLLGHTTSTPEGSLIHFSPMNTVLLENVPKHEFAIFAHDVAGALGLNNS